MSKATQQQDVAVLSSSKQGLVFLTANDWALIVDKGSRMQFKVGDRVVQHGKRTHGIYLLLKGTASVQIPRPAISPFALPAIGPGEVCGEISFLDELPATASVVAKEPVEAYYLDRPTLQSLFELFPHLGSRFYRSLACSLSRRLREWIGPADAVKLDSLRPDPIKDPVKADSAKKE
jgi:CRP-like cAMP-binding protein